MNEEKINAPFKNKKDLVIASINIELSRMDLADLLPLQIRIFEDKLIRNKRKVYKTLFEDKQ
jgi:hypothetical protein